MSERRNVTTLETPTRKEQPCSKPSSLKRMEGSKMMDGQKGKRRAGEGVRSPRKGKILAVLLFWDRGNLLATLIYGRTCVRVCRGTLRAMGPPLLTEVPVHPHPSSGGWGRASARCASSIPLLSHDTVHGDSISSADEPMMKAKDGRIPREI